MSARTKAIIKNATKKQQSFITALEEGKTAKEALEIAGYQPKNATQSKSSKTVQKALAQIEENTRELTSIQRQDVIEGLLSAIMLAENLDDPATMIRGWNEISKLHGYHAPEKRELSVKGQVDHSHTGDLKLEQLPTSKLIELSKKNEPIDISEADYKRVDNERGAQEEVEEESQDSSEDLFDPTDD